MGVDIVEKKLYDTASKGDLPTLVQLLQQDPYLVDGVSFSCSRNLLHIATMFGHLAIVEEVLNINPRLARILDSQKLSPLHIAAAEGHVEIAKKLISVAPEACWWRDSHGMNPVHVAAMNGHVEILEELIQMDHLPAMERVNRGQTVLHLCVKHRQLRALKVLVEKLGEIVDAKDDDGETLLHLAVRSNQLEIIQYLVEINKINQRTRNSMGKTLLQILADSPPGTANYSEIKALLRFSNPSILISLPTDMTMVVVALIATMAFQAAVSPPGGVWPDETPSHEAGKVVMASTHPRIYKHFARANTTAFVSSLITIFVIATGGFSEHPFYSVVAVCTMWVSLVAIAVSYGASTAAIITPVEAKSHGLIGVMIGALTLSICVLASIYFDMRKMYRFWRTEKRHQQNLATKSLYLRALYWIFQQLETRGYLRA